MNRYTKKAFGKDHQKKAKDRKGLTKPPYGKASNGKR